MSKVCKPAFQVRYLKCLSLNEVMFLIPTMVFEDAAEEPTSDSFSYLGHFSIDVVRLH